MKTQSKIQVETQRGWWTLTIDGIEGDLSDSTLEHIAKMIEEGNTSGEVIEGDDE